MGATSQHPNPECMKNTELTHTGNPHYYYNCYVKSTIIYQQFHKKICRSH